MSTHSTSLESSINYLSEKANISTDEIFEKYDRIKIFITKDNQEPKQKLENLVYDTLSRFIDYIILSNHLGFDDINGNIDKILSYLDTIGSTIYINRQIFKDLVKEIIERSEFSDEEMRKKFPDTIQVDYDIYINSLRFLNSFIPIDKLERYIDDNTDYKDYGTAIVDIMYKFDADDHINLARMNYEIAFPKKETPNPEKETPSPDKTMFLMILVSIIIVLSVLTAGVWLVFVVAALFINYKRSDYKNVSDRTKWVNALLGPVSIIMYFYKKNRILKSF